MADPVTLRSFDDADATRDLIYKNALGAVSRRFPVEDDEYRVELRNPKYSGPMDFTMEEQKQALMKDRSLHTPITGTMRLIHKPTNTVLDEREDVVMHVPYYTPRGTIIRGGNEYSVSSQSRLRSGVYVRKQRTGEIEGHFNVKSGTGKPFRIHLEPSTGVFKVAVGQSSIPIYPLMKAMGVQDRDLVKAWGPDLAATNIKNNDVRSLPKLYQRMAGYKADPTLDTAGQERYLREELPKFQLDQEVNARTLGLENAGGVTPEVLLRTTRKMLGVSRGDEQADDRDSPQFSTVHSVEDLIQERIDKDAGNLAKNSLRKIRRSRNLTPLHRGFMNQYVDSLMLGSGLAQPIDETNPMSTLEQQNRITKMGEGGIGSAEAITEEARDVNPGQLGLIDPIAGPESSALGVDVRAVYGAKKGSDNNIYGEFRNAKTGKIEHLRAAQTINSVVAYPGQMSKNTPTVYAMKNGQIAQVPREEVQYEVPSIGHMFSSHINLNPMPTAVQAGRQFYAAKFWSQFMPQVKGEVPLVDSLMHDGKTTFSEHYGRKLGTIQSKVGGVVTKVTPDSVTVVDADGKKHVSSLVKDLPFNRLTSISYHPAVAVGQQVNVGDMVAHSNFTDKATGALNMGQNLRTAMIPDRGRSHEDAYTISESAAKRLSTDRLMGYDLEARHGTEMGRSRFISLFPRSYTQPQIENLDEHGVAKPGTVLHKGDPIVLATGPKLLTAEDAQLGKLHKVLRNAFTDKSITWDYDWPGTVSDVAVTRKGAKVNVKSQPPVAVGDKLSSRFAIKGVVGEIRPDDKMPRETGTNLPYEMLLNPMTIPSRVAPNQVMEMTLSKVAKATGKQIRIPQEPPPEGWNAWVKKQLEDANIKESADLFDPESGKTIKNIGDGHIYVAAFHHLAEKKLSARGDSGSYDANEQPTRGGHEGAKRFCFPADQLIRVAGGEEQIGYLVEQRVPAMVQAPDDNGLPALYRIKNWFTRRGRVEEVITIRVAGVIEKIGSRCKADSRILTPTKNHEVYLADGKKVKAGSIKVGDWMQTFGYVMSPDQRSLLIGSMLGNGSVGTEAHTWKSSFHEMHSIKQMNYHRWRAGILRLLLSSRSESSRKDEVTNIDGVFSRTGGRKRVCYFSINRHDIVSELAGMFIRDGKKCITQEVLDAIDERAICAWFLDDGSCGNRSKKKGKVKLQGKISTMGFTAEDVDRLAQRMCDLGFECHSTKSRELYLSHPTCMRLAELVSRYVPAEAIPGSKRWLKDFAYEYQKSKTPYAWDSDCVWGVVPVYVYQVEPYVHPIHGLAGDINLYDIEVEDVHKYCAAGVVVSNSSMDAAAALAHGATDVIKDVAVIRGTKNEDYWKALKLGKPLPEPGVPFVYTKFMNTLKAGGINLSQKGDTTTLLPMTDKDVDVLSQGSIAKSDMVDHDFEPMAGGLFDLGKTGGLSGNKWTHIDLPEPVPNPVMEEPIRRLLGLKVKDIEEILAGRQQLNGLTGGPALKSALDKIDIEDMISSNKSKVRTLRGANRDNAIKIIGYLSSAKE